MDDTIVHCQKPLTEYLLDKYNIPLLDHSEVTIAERDQYYEDHGLSREQIIEVFENPSFFENLQWIENAKEGFLELFSNKGINLYLATSLPELHQSSVVEGKIRWIKRELPDFDLKNLIFTKQKQLLLGDWLIDDRPEFLSNFRGHKIEFRFREEPTRIKDISYTHDWYEVESWLDINQIISIRSILR